MVDSYSESGLIIGHGYTVNGQGIPGDIDLFVSDEEPTHKLGTRVEHIASGRRWRYCHFAEDLLPLLEVGW